MSNLYVVPIGSDGTRGEVTEVHPRSIVAWNFARSPAPQIVVNGILYERAPAPAEATP